MPFWINFVNREQKNFFIVSQLRSRTPLPIAFPTNLISHGICSSCSNADNSKWCSIKSTLEIVIPICTWKALLLRHAQLNISRFVDLPSLTTRDANINFNPVFTSESSYRIDEMVVRICVCQPINGIFFSLCVYIRIQFGLRSSSSSFSLCRRIIFRFFLFYVALSLSGFVLLHNIYKLTELSSCMVVYLTLRKTNKKTR